MDNWTSYAWWSKWGPLPKFNLNFGFGLGFWLGLVSICQVMISNYQSQCSVYSPSLSALTLHNTLIYQMISPDHYLYITERIRRNYEEIKLFLMPTEMNMIIIFDSNRLYKCWKVKLWPNFGFSNVISKQLLAGRPDYLCLTNTAQCNLY